MYIQSDENTLPKVDKIFKTEAQTFNIFDKLMQGMQVMPKAKILANGDLPIFSYDQMDKYNKSYFAIRDKREEKDDYILEAEANSDGILCPHCNHILKYKLNNYSSLGDFTCPNCDFSSPKITYKLDKIEKLEANYSSFYLDDEFYEVNVGGLYNVYNALAALSVAKELGLNYKEVYEGLASQKNVFGRQENIKIGDKNVTINLVKNPTGLNQIIDLMLLEKEPISLICLLNDNYADGTDVSWIYDSYYENLSNLTIKDVYVSGMRKKDMKRRLEIAEIFDGEIKEFDYENEIEKVIKDTKTNNIYILSTYTAMLRLREVLNL